MKIVLDVCLWLWAWVTEGVIVVYLWLTKPRTSR